LKICQVCGKTIEFASKAKKYCSPECRAHVKYEKDRAWLAARPGKAAEYSRNWYAANTEICKQASRDRYRRKCLERIEEGRNG
jgi:hypothetical protein